jgi:hypothetical protein
MRIINFELFACKQQRSFKIQRIYSQIRINKEHIFLQDLGLRSEKAFFCNKSKEIRLNTI